MRTTLPSTPAVDACAPPDLVLRFVGAADALTPDDRAALFERSTSTDETVRERTRAIIRRVRDDGDRALRALARELDGADLDALEIAPARCRSALDAMAPDLRRAMERAAANIETVHRAALPQATSVSPEPGIVIDRRPDPLARVGVYAPGGRATYPSSVLMGVIPARVAGVREIILCTPPARDGAPGSALLAAAALAGVDRLFAIGGAGAIAAMAFGTETVPRVDRIVGPGNAYVAEAKLQVAGSVAIDLPAGPSELLVIADAASDPEVVAREVVAQAEHDPRACAVVICVGGPLDAIGRALARAVARAHRRDIVERALAGQGGILGVPSIADAIALATRYAPEHLLITLDSPEAERQVADRVRNAGTVFLGSSSSNAFGDYMTGANHVLPTGGLARSYSGLSTLDFVRWTTVQRVVPTAAAGLADDVSLFAEAEGLPGHAAAARGATYACRDIDLSDNTNLWGMPPAARNALISLSARDWRYPSPYSARLKAALGRYLGVAGDEQIITGCGSDDVIDATMRAFAVPGARLAYSEPTFSMIPTFARLNGLTPVPVALGDADTAFDVRPEALLATDAEIIYVCGPNNPTGTRVSRRAVEYLIERAPGIVMLDEAYAEFAGESFVDLVARSERLIVTRTLSKAFGLAGLRVGYGVAAPALAGLVERARGPYKVNAAAERCALAALGEEPDARPWVEVHAALAVEIRDWFSAELRSLGFAPLPSAANFVLVPHERAVEIDAALRAHGVLVRTLVDLPMGLRALAAAGGRALRIGVGPRADMMRVLAAFATVGSR